MLTLTLRGLERDGLVSRTVCPTVPPRLDYALTKLGTTLLEPDSSLAAWAEAHAAEMQASRERCGAMDADEPKLAASGKR